ncbi:SHOCT domain-containing protein [Shouchella miscanthi]|uniref:SHOCT domain-containing protein n=1 Tax=Shouchella miscanthi TaxID=2598861 RepID=A0ABU6NI19_9BACI|nr:SHOCT domain-containing protein [Shouchella miscanthi]
MSQTFKGSRSTLTIEDDKLIIKHNKIKSLGGGARKEIVIPFNELENVIIRKPGIVSGFCYLQRKGASPDISRFQATNDEFSIVLTFSYHYKRFLKAKKLIETKLENVDTASESELDRIYHALISDPDQSIKFAGYNGSLEITRDNVTILYNGFLHSGGRGQKTIQIKEINSISLSKNTFVSGKFQLHYNGFQDRRNGILASAANELSITNINEYNRFLQAKELIERIKHYHNSHHDFENSYNQYAEPAHTPRSTADELREFKALLDEGIITDEEFEKKKAQLLR